MALIEIEIKTRHIHNEYKNKWRGVDIYFFHLVAAEKQNKLTLITTVSENISWLFPVYIHIDWFSR